MSLYTSLTVSKLNGIIKSFPKFNRIEEINQDGIYVSFCNGDTCAISTMGGVEWSEAKDLRPKIEFRVNDLAYVRSNLTTMNGNRMCEGEVVRIESLTPNSNGAIDCYSFRDKTTYKIPLIELVKDSSLTGIDPEAKPSLLEQFAKSLNISNQDLIDALLEADIGVSLETLGLKCEYEDGAYYPAIDNHGIKCVIHCYSTDPKVMFNRVGVMGLLADSRGVDTFKWIGGKLDIAWSEEAE